MPGYLSRLNQLSQLSFGFKASIVGIVLMLTLISYGLFASEQFAAHLEASKMDLNTGELVADLKALNAELGDLVTLERAYVSSRNDRELYYRFNKQRDNLSQQIALINGLNTEGPVVKDLTSRALDAVDKRVHMAEAAVTEKANPGNGSNLANNLKSHTNQYRNDFSNEDFWELSSGQRINQVVKRAKQARDTYLQGLETTNLIMFCCIWSFRLAALATATFIILLATRYISEKRKMEKLLLIAETKYRAILEQTFQFSAILSPDGKLIEFSKSLASLPEVNQKDNSQRKFWEFEWWQNSPSTQEKLEAAMVEARDGKFTRFEGELVSGQGKKALDLSVRPVFDHNGKLNLIIVEAEDITVRKIAEKASAEKAARIQAIVETAPDAILTLKTNGQIESANQAAATLFGSKTEDLVGQNIELMLPTFFDDENEYIESFDLKSGERGIIEIGRENIWHQKNGNTLPVELSLSLMNLGDSSILTTIIRDISERKQAQKRVKHFYSAVSHELRTPLTSIRTALGLIEDDTKNSASPETVQAVAIAQTESERLIRLINDLLDIRKIEEGKIILHYEPIGVKQLLDTAFNGISAIASKAEVNLEKRLSFEGTIICDPDRITQVLSNLLSNAIKFSEKNDTITVVVDSNPSATIFSVCDQGPGVAASEIHKLFGQFEQLDLTKERTKQGSGLGLAISKAIIEHHRGQIGVDQLEPRGCRFWFALPSHKASGGATIASQSLHPDESDAIQETLTRADSAVLH